jgi:hypothetical protein
MPYLDVGPQDYCCKCAFRAACVPPQGQATQVADEPHVTIGPQMATVRALVAEGQYGALRSIRSRILVYHAHADGYRCRPDWGVESFSMPRAIGCRRFGGMVAALHEVAGTVFGYLQHDPVADFASLAIFGDLTRDESLQTGYRGAGGHVTFNAAIGLRLSLYRIYPYLVMLVESILRSSSTVDHRCTSVFVSWHLMRERAVLTEATR